MISWEEMTEQEVVQEVGQSTVYYMQGMQQELRKWLSVHYLKLGIRVLTGLEFNTLYQIQEHTGEEYHNALEQLFRNLMPLVELGLDSDVEDALFYIGEMLYAYSRLKKMWELLGVDIEDDVWEEMATVYSDDRVEYL